MTPTRTGAAAAVWTLAAGVFAAMLVAPGVLREVLVPVLAAAGLLLHLVSVRSLGPSSWRRVAVLWSVQAGLTWLVAGDPTTTSALVYIVIGLVFALVAVVVLRVLARFAAADAPPDPDEPEVDGARRPTDTAPLPIREREG